MFNGLYNAWDITLILTVTLQGVALAYLYNPKWKAFMLNLPIPFTIAVLAVGRPIDATNVIGLVDLLLFTNGVRWLYRNAGWPIVVAIVVATLGYCLVGIIAAKIIPSGDYAFWAASAAVMVLGGILYRHCSYPEEKGRRVALAVWIKLPVIFCVVCALVLIKRSLLGFTTVFPMVGVIAAYEGRHCLGAISRQMPVIMLTLTPLMVVCRLFQESLGLIGSLLLGWGVFLMILIPITRHMWMTAQNGR